MAPDVTAFEGNSGRPFLRLLKGDGQCEVSVRNGHITSWKVAGADLIYLSEKSKWEDNKAVRGGIPLCWPQFAGDGPWGNHGFLRTTTEWKVLGEPDVDGDPSVTLILTDCDDSRKTGFVHKFKMLYKIT
eukprot:Polyplicarium_translucidae@DN2674_c0_g1_i1.p2